MPQTGILVLHLVKIISQGQLIPLKIRLFQQDRRIGLIGKLGLKAQLQEFLIEGSVITDKDFLIQTQVLQTFHKRAASGNIACSPA